jgi:protein TonB
MSRQIFDDVVRPSVTVGTRKWYTVPVSIGTHLIVLGALAAVPILATDILPLPDSIVIFAVPPPHPTPPPSQTRTVTDQRPVDIIEDAAPLEAPAALTSEPSEPPRALAGVVAGGDAAGLTGGVDSTLRLVPPQPSSSGAPVRVGGVIQQPRLTRRIDPVYPAVARSARLQGYVIVEATIGRDGAVKDVRVLKPAHPLLDKAALDAVAQWRYSPTTLNGEAVEVQLSVTVTFTLQ